MLNKKRLGIVICGAVAAVSVACSEIALAREPVVVSSVSALNPVVQINAIEAADLLLATFKHNVEPANDDIAVAALDSTGIPALPNMAGRGSANTNYNVFGSVVIPVGALPAAKSWNHAATGDFLNVFGAGCPIDDCRSGLRKTFAEAAREAETLSPVEALSFINRTVNRNLRYSSDEDAWHRGDYWASPEEIAAKGVGDCEDFATTKLWLLRSIGFDESQLQLVVLKDTRRQLYHAVLTVHIDGKAYVLDNLSNTVASDTAFISYVPIMSFVGGKNYIHGFQDRRTGVAANDLSAVMPGE